jgi:hypothetical protein
MDVHELELRDAGDEHRMDHDLPAKPFHQLALGDG